MEKPVLVIMAAGMGSRYGGLKQIDPIDELGHMIIDFSIFDAKRAGFEKVIFVIKKENELLFKKMIGNRISNMIDVEYVFQDLNNLPNTFSVPNGRTKPWGTAHAILSCQNVINGPFAVINADDYYGRDAFQKIYHFLSKQTDDNLNHFAMIGYHLNNTLTDNGYVARGICTVDDNSHLIEIIERTHIKRIKDKIVFMENNSSWVELPDDSIVSMNMWGFSYQFLEELKNGFFDFLKKNLKNNPLNCEYFLPTVVNDLLLKKHIKVSVLISQDKWYGMTYKEDKKHVVAAIQDMKKNGIYPDKLWSEKSEALFHFDLDGTEAKTVPFGSGHINDTFLVTLKRNDNTEHRVILQKMNKKIFKKPEELMENIAGITSFLRKKIIENGGDPNRETLNIILTKDKKPFFIDSVGEYWRCYHFIEDATSFDQVETPEDFYQSGFAFGHFQRMLAEYPATTLHETIEGFHDTAARFNVFKKAVQDDICQRAALVKPEIEFVLAHEELAYIFNDMIKNNEIPIRVTHNDTKLNNVMIDNQTHKGICVIDLDTVMPGLAMNDFGDSIRFGANTAAEDEINLDKVSCDMELFDIFAKGFIEGCDGRLTPKEIELLPMGAKVMTFECGMRFLTDYLQGDIYFKIHRENQNLDRCRTQFKLVSDMESKWDMMNKIIKKYNS